MIKLKWIVLLSMLAFSSTALCWVNDVAYIHGVVTNVDKNTVTIVDANKNEVVLPRTVIPKKYVLHTTGKSDAIPVYASQMGRVLQSHSRIKWTKPKMTAEDAERRLAEQANNTKVPQ